MFKAMRKHESEIF